jgi:hypothetical protein
LEPRLDVQDGVGVVEFVVRSVRAIFLLSLKEGNTWTLQVIEDGRAPQMLSSFRVERRPNRHRGVMPPHAS